MKLRPTLRLSGCLGLAALLPAACQMQPRPDLPPLPVQPWPGAEAALAQMAARDAQLVAQRAQGTLTLERGGDSVSLEAVLILASPPDAPPSLRLRAWKFGRTVLDLTLNREGAWVLDGSGADPGQGPAEGLAKLGAVLPRFTGGRLWREAEVRAEDERTLTLALADGARLKVDKPTQALTRVEVPTPQGALLMDFGFAEVAAPDGGRHLLPARVGGTAPDGAKFSFRAAKLEANPALPAAAFKPPPAARKMP